MNAAEVFQAPHELVRGNVKAAMKSVGATSSDLWQVPIENLRFIDGFNGRVDTPDYLTHIENIAQSIIENGYYQDKPIAGYVADEDGAQVIYVTEGHTRVRSTKVAVERGAPITTLPVVVKPKGTTLEDLTIAMIKSNEGRPFSPYETALIVKRLIDMGMVEKEVARRLGITTNYVNDLLTLAGAPKVVRDMVIAGQVAATAAIKEVKQNGAKSTARLKDALSRAKSEGKEKVTGKHLATPKPATLKIKGVVAKFLDIGGSRVQIDLDLPLDVALNPGDTVRLVISESDEL